jgi:pimeloyl-ACP methyl ester carboxylesterase
VKGKTRGLGCLAGLVLVLAVAWAARSEPAPGPVGGWMAGAGVAPAFVDVGGVRVRYVRKGSGPAVVLIHGFASSIFTWKDVLPALAQGHDVVAIDLPGFGGSDIPRPLVGTTYPSVALAVMDRLGIGRAALVGNSLGGSVAVGMAAERPERVTALVLIDSAGFNFDAGDRPPLLRLIAAPGVGSALEKVPVRRRLVAAGLEQVFFDDTLVTAERIDEYAVPMSRPGAARAAAELLAGESPPFRDVVGRVRAPALVIWGRNDTWIPVAHAQRFTEAIPGSTAVILDSCGHLPQEEKPAEVSALILRFLAAAARVD